MILKQIIDESFIDYRKISMYLGFPACDFKCDRECGLQVCQNSALANSPTIDVEIDTIIERYLSNGITKAVVIAGLEPFNTYDMLIDFVRAFRKKSMDDIVIYTGYYKEEISIKIDELKKYSNRNIIIKFGRFIPNQETVYNEIMGVKLASGNQYAEII